MLTENWRCDPFWQSDIGLPIQVDERRDSCQEFKKQVLMDTVLAHQSLFSLLLDQPVTYSQDPKNRRRLIANVLAYAKYYGLFELVHGRVVDDLLAWPDLWKDISSSPYFYIGLSQVIRCKEIFFETLRHLVFSVCYHGCRDCYAERITMDMEEMSADELKMIVLECRDRLQLLPTRILDSIQHRCLRPDKVWSRSGKTVMSTEDRLFLEESTIHKGRRALHRSKRERLEFLVRSVFAEWMHERLDDSVHEAYGDERDHCGSTRQFKSLQYVF